MGRSNIISIKYYYDPNGNTTAKNTMSIASTGGEKVSIGAFAVTNADVTLYGYNGLNQLVSVSENGMTSSYTYDGTGLRQSKTVNGTTTTHIWDGTNMVAEANGAYILKRYYRGANGLIFANLAGTETKYLKDGHGNITGLANMSGTTLNKAYCYDAFGVEKNIDTTDKNPFRYCGEYYDNEIDKIYLRARYYSPIQGRFITEDPIKDGLNWYAYCNGNPITFVDPSGLDAIILTSSTSVAGAGHTSAIYQDKDGNWYYTYWGIDAAYVINIPNENMGSLDDFNEYLNQTLKDNDIHDWIDDYDNATYVVGDFTASLSSAYNAVREANTTFGKSEDMIAWSDGSLIYEGLNSSYNLVEDNCLQRTMEDFGKGVLANGEKVSTYLENNNYSVGMIPNEAKDKISEMFMNTSFNANNARKKLDDYVQLFRQGSSWAKNWYKYDYARSVM